jgi:hypothetical protein
LAGASSALRVAGNAGSGGLVRVLVGVASLHTLGSTFVVSCSAIDAVVASGKAAVALRVAGLAESIDAEVVDGASFDASAVQGESSDTACAVLGVVLAGSAS